jgi:tripartite-type tricarboxylate transporter receptor subunit TctC
MVVANAKPDGYTILQGDSGPLAIVPAMRKVNYDPRKLEAVGPMVTLPYVLAVSPGLGVKSLPDLVKLAKSQPDKLNYASSSAMVVLGMELLKKKLEINVLHIPYGGAAPALMSILSGQTHMMFLNPLALQPYLESGQMLALGIAAPTRSPILPDVPTFDELGIPGMDVQTYVGLFAPRGTPSDVINRLNRALADVMSQADIQTDLKSQGAVVIKDSGAAHFGTEMEKEREKWMRLVSESGLALSEKSDGQAPSK